MIIILLAACLGSSTLEPGDPHPYHDENPSISDVTWSCDPEEGSWSFTVKTEHWTGGGWVWLGVSPSNVESHKLRSVDAAADGSDDKLKLELDIKEDWRDASRNSSTRWLCSDEPRLSFMVTVYDPSGSDVEDCRTWGHRPSVWNEIDAAYDCDVILELPEEDLDTGE
jgi:hypothetical protein